MTKLNDKLNKIILFINDDEQETRYITAKFLDNELVINFSNFNHTVKYVVDYRYKFNKKETNKFTKLLAKNKSDFLYKLKERFNTSSACADLTKYATDNNIDYDFIYGHEGENLYRYEIGDVFLDEDLLYDKNKNVIIPSFYTHPKNGIMELYLPNGNLFMSISYKNNKKNGFTKCYSKKNQKLLWEQNYTNDKLDGITKKYYSDGSLEREETFIMGIKEGVDKYYDADGYLEQEEMWAKNQRNGFARKYYSNGQVKHEAFFKNDLQEGCTHEYYESGKLKYEGEFKNDSATGWGIRYYENGNIMWKSPHGKLKGVETKYYENGNIEFTIETIGENRNGKYTNYYEDGKIRGVGFYKNDKRHGISRNYYKNGKLHEEIPYKNGQVSGIGTSYYSNGKIHYTCEYKNGLRNGYSVSYDKNDNILQKVLYKNGLVVDFNDNDGIKGILGLKETDAIEHKEDVFVSNDGIEKKQKNRKNSNIKSKINSTTSRFNLDFVNCSRDIKFLTDKILANKNLNFSMCIYGDPGTGKSAYARYLADKLGINVICKSAADILDQYVGNSEKLIAEAFEEAEKKKAMLIIDEVDSFLRSRGLAQRNWEVTMVNQMLTCMEKFNLPFICTTNFIDMLDQASLRRFTFKFKFGFLKQNQIELAFYDIFRIKPSDTILKMQGLTVSDFINIKRECDILGITDINEITNMLEETVSLKESEEISTKIGFAN